MKIDDRSQKPQSSTVTNFFQKSQIDFKTIKSTSQESNGKKLSSLQQIIDQKVEALNTLNKQILDSDLVNYVYENKHPKDCAAKEYKTNRSPKTNL